MKAKDIKTVQEIVEGILTESRPARNSDNVLFFKVYQMLLAKQGIDITKLSAAMLFLNMKNYGLPPIETIRRSRQKLQAENIYLRADRDVTEARQDNEEAFRKYARE